MKKLLLLTFAAFLAVSAYARDVGRYTVEEMSEDEKPMPFHIGEIEQKSGELRIFPREVWGYADHSEIARLISTGKLEAQLSDSESNKDVPLSLRKAVTCKDARGNRIGPYYLGYSEAIPTACKVVEQIKYYLRAPVTLGKERDLAIGIDPDFMWLIEEK